VSQAVKSKSSIQGLKTQACMIKLSIVFSHEFIDAAHAGAQREEQPVPRDVLSAGASH
jgi:hypothetical protein